MRHRALWTLSLLVTVLPGAALAGSFEPSALLPEAGIDALDRATARQHLERDLFGDPYASVVIGQVDVYDRFPYLEARYFEVISDPAWNRLLFGEAGKGLDAFDGSASSFGELRAPRGLASDEWGHLYVADSDNDRILVFETRSEFDQLELIPLYEIDDVRRPHDVAFSDGGTPFEATDDRLYVAETGRNRVDRYELGPDAANLSSNIGGLGGGVGRFGGPTAVAVGRDDGRNNATVYVADSHGSRIVRLVDDDGTLRWNDALRHELGTITSLDTDHWGNVYAASPQTGMVEKFGRDLLPLAELSDGVNRPRAFHVPMLTVNDHRDGTIRRAGHGSGVVVEQWTDNSGLRLMDLGVEIRDVTVHTDSKAQASFTVTDHARLVAEVTEMKSGKLIAQRELGMVEAGRQDIDLDAMMANVPAGAGDYLLHVRAESSYDRKRSDIATTSFAYEARGQALPKQPMVLGPNPNPFNPSTTIEFVVPQGGALPYRLDILDVRGRVVRRLEQGTAQAGQHGVVWNGNDDRGDTVGSGVYFFRLTLGGEVHSGKLALLK